MRSRTVMRLSQKRERRVAGEGGGGSVCSVVRQTCSSSQSPGVVVTLLIAAIKYLLKHVKEGKGLTLGHSWSIGHCAGMLRGQRLQHLVPVYPRSGSRDRQSSCSACFLFLQSRTHPMEWCCHTQGESS